MASPERVGDGHAARPRLSVDGLLELEVLEGHRAAMLAVWLAKRSRHPPVDWQFSDGTVVRVEDGEYATTERDLAHDRGCGRNAVRDDLAGLVRRKVITITHVAPRPRPRTRGGSESEPERPRKRTAFSAAGTLIRVHGLNHLRGEVGSDAAPKKRKGAGSALNALPPVVPGKDAASSGVTTFESPAEARDRAEKYERMKAEGRPPLEGAGPGESEPS